MPTTQRLEPASASKQTGVLEVFSVTATHVVHELTCCRVLDLMSLRTGHDMPGTRLVLGLHPGLNLKVTSSLAMKRYQTGVALDVTLLQQLKISCLYLFSWTISLTRESLDALIGMKGCTYYVLRVRNKQCGPGVTNLRTEYAATFGLCIDVCYLLPSQEA